MQAGPGERTGVDAQWSGTVVRNNTTHLQPVTCSESFVPPAGQRSVKSTTMGR